MQKAAHCVSVSTATGRGFPKSSSALARGPTSKEQPVVSECIACGACTQIFPAQGFQSPRTIWLLSFGKRYSSFLLPLG